MAEFGIIGTIVVSVIGFVLLVLAVFAPYFIYKIAKNTARTNVLLERLVRVHAPTVKKAAPKGDDFSS